MMIQTVMNGLFADRAGEGTAMITSLAQHWPFWGWGFFAGSVAMGWLAWLTRHRRGGAELPEVLAVVEAERKRIAADLHDDLGTRLTEIGLLSNSAAANLSAAELRSLWERIGAQAESSVRSLDAIVWAINPANDCVTSVADYFCLHAQAFLREASVRCRLDVAGNLANLLLGPEPRHELFLAFKEALHNVVRHAGASEVRLAIGTRRNALLISVTDDGRGLPDSLPAAGADGLRNMRQRLERLGGSCVFRSAPGRGTTVEFRLPVASTAATWGDRWRRLLDRFSPAAGRTRPEDRARAGSAPRTRSDDCAA